LGKHNLNNTHTAIHPTASQQETDTGCSQPSDNCSQTTRAVPAEKIADHAGNCSYEKKS